MRGVTPFDCGSPSVPRGLRRTGFGLLALSEAEGRIADCGFPITNYELPSAFAGAGAMPRPRSVPGAAA